MNFLLGLPVGEEVELVTQRKQDSECVCMCVCVREREKGVRGPGLSAIHSQALGRGGVWVPPVHGVSPSSLPEDGAVWLGRLLLHPHAL